MGNRIIRLLWDETYVRDHRPELAASTYLPPFDIPYEVYDEDTGEVEVRGVLAECYFSRITMNEDSLEHNICTPVEITDFTGDDEPWHAVNSVMITEKENGGEPS